MRCYGAGWFLSIFLSLAAFSGATAQEAGWYPTEFAATLRIVDGQMGEEQLVRYYVGNRKFRVDSAEEGAGGGMILLFGDEHATTITFDDATKQYLEFTAPIGAVQNDFLDGVMALGALERTCEVDSNLTCTREGTDRLLDRPVEKWIVTERHEDGNVVTTTMWLDRELHFALRSVSSDGEEIEVTDLDVGPQPAHLFAVPSDYEKAY